MPDENPTRVEAGDLWLAQRVIVLQLLRDDRDLLWSRRQLRRELPDISGRVFRAALEVLEDDGCIVLGSGGVRASICAQHLDALGLVAI